MANASSQYTGLTRSLLYVSSLPEHLDSLIANEFRGECHRKLGSLGVDELTIDSPCSNQ